MISEIKIKQSVTILLNSVSDRSKSNGNELQEQQRRHAHLKLSPQTLLNLFHSADKNENSRTLFL